MKLVCKCSLAAVDKQNKHGIINSKHALCLNPPPIHTSTHRQCVEQASSREEQDLVDLTTLLPHGDEGKSERET